EPKSKVLALINAQGEEVEALSASDELVELVISPSPFYPEGGGQVGDAGILKSSSLRFEVEDTKKGPGSFAILNGRLKQGTLKMGSSVEAEVDRARRLKTRINHTITHILHAALQKVLGEHIKQAGSLVHPDYLRFDFNHFQ